MSDASDPNHDARETAPARSKPERRIWLRVLSGFAVLLLLVMVAGPPLASRWLRGKIESSANERIDGKVTLGSLSLKLNGKATLEDLVIEDRDGVLVARVPSVRADVGLRSLLGGKKDVAVLVEGAELEVVRRADGSWNLADLLREAADESEGDSEPVDVPRSPPDLEGRIELLDATVTVRSPDTALELRETNVRVGLDGEDREVSLEGGARVFASEGTGGRFVLDAALWPDAGPGARIDEAGVRELDLAIFQEALSLVGSPLEEGSRLSGDVDLVVTGRVSDLDPAAAFEGTASGVATNLEVDVRRDGLRTFAFSDENATLDAQVDRIAGGAQPTARLQLRARDGKVRADATYDGAAQQGFAADVVVDGLNASAGLEPLLARVHPAFASARAIEGAGLDGLVSTNLAIRYDAPLPLDTLAAGWSALPKAPLSGNGSLSIDEGLVETSPFFAKLLAAFDQPTNPTFDLQPLGFAVQAGRLAYTSPWTWTIQGTETNFAGSVGLDGTLDLRWRVPITGGLADQNRFFSEIAGETFEVALGGTLSSPRFDLAGALARVARSAAENRIREEIEDAESDLRDKAKELLGEEIDKVLGGGEVEETATALEKLLGGGKVDPADLLKKADELWDAGKKKEAAPLYRRIRDEFPLSPVYLLNKKRVKARRNG